MWCRCVSVYEQMLQLYPDERFQKPLIFFIFNLFFNFILKKPPGYIFADLTFLSCRSAWRDKNTLSRHMHWRDKMCHVGTF